MAIALLEIVLLYAFGIVLLLIILFFAFWKLWFLRDPTREIPYGNNIVSPADGKIVSIIDISKKTHTIKKGLGKVKVYTNDINNAKYIVSIFMNVFSVHVNRAPIEGKVIKIKYDKGKFLKVNSFENGLVNEKNSMIIKGNKEVKVIQIAGFLARRIECWVKQGENIIKGQRIGRINLGSQVTLVLQKDVKLKVKKGQKVYAGTTIIAELK